MNRFPVMVIASLSLGFIAGRILSPDLGNLYEWVLYALIFLIGVDLGKGLDFNALRKSGSLGVFLAITTILGSIAGALLAGLFLGIPPRYASAIGAGCGWYSITGPIIAQYSAIYGTLGFLANLLREILTVILYPFSVRLIPPEVGLTMGGATTMDTTLGIITRAGGKEIALIAFVHGFVITMVVPILLPLILGR
ncbi:lysine exporter LysO family protein [Thermococcus waiotapuensis]|uniref:Lysine exporter LysO family protein n=1 Tax=Thermococcus waiotapuensis TaxID=90909 RepID=A0AAE4NUY5_9EURY|nr:lysine exporter LysO family protein [Thermococcus waiotapuensis]MDV3104324.1 lysine exporter LysO family protein [Thermococcus waiotapuensis]